MKNHRSERKPESPTHLHRFELHKRFSTRLQRTAGIDDVQTEPSAFRPTKIRASVEGNVFGVACPDGELEVEWRPRTGSTDEFRMQFTPSDDRWSCGWHQDETHSDLGACHFQIDHRDWTEPKRTGVVFDDGLPMAVFEACLDELREYGATPESIAERS